MAKVKHYKKVGTPLPTTKPTGKRVVDFDGGYSVPYTPRKTGHIIALGTTLYGDGFFCNGGRYIIKMAKPDRMGCQSAHNAMKRLLAVNPPELARVAIGKETYNSAARYKYPIVQIGPVRVPAEHLDMVMKHHPDAQPHILPDARAVYFFAHGIDELVGIIAPIWEG